MLWGYGSTKYRTIRAPLLTGFVIWTAAIIGFCTVGPGQSTHALVFSGLAGIGSGAPLILIISGVQSSTPHHLIATATAVTTSSRAVAATVFTATYSAAFTSKLDAKLPSYISKAGLAAGLSQAQLKAFAGAIADNNATGLAQYPSSAVNAGTLALKHAFSDSTRTVFIVAAPFGIVACIACLCLGNLRKTMNYCVDAPVESLQAKKSQQREV